MNNFDELTMFFAELVEIEERLNRLLLKSKLIESSSLFEKAEEFYIWEGEAARGAVHIENTVKILLEKLEILKNKDE